MVCPEKVKIGEVNDEQEELCATIKKLCKNSENAFRFGSSTADKEACFPPEIISNISSFLIDPEEKILRKHLGQKFESRVVKNFKTKGREEKVEISEAVFKDGQLEELTVTIDGIKHEELRPSVIEGNTQNIWIIDIKPYGPIMYTSATPVRCKSSGKGSYNNKS